MLAFLAAHRAEIFPDAELVVPPGVGRSSLLATQMAAVLVLQVLHDYSDQETAEAVRFDVRWKVAIEASPDGLGFDPPRWCTGTRGWRSPAGRTGSTTRSRR